MDKTPDTEKKNSGYARMPRIIRKGYKQLTKLQKLLYIYLRDLCGEAKDGICYRSLRTLADETDFSIGYLSENIPELVEAGLIKAYKQKRNNHKWEVWHITIVDIWDLNTKFIESEKCSSDEQMDNQESVQDTNGSHCEQIDQKSVRRVNELDEKCSHGANKQEKSLNKNPSTLNKNVSTAPGVNASDSGEQTDKPAFSPDEIKIVWGTWYRSQYGEGITPKTSQHALQQCKELLEKAHGKTALTVEIMNDAREWAQRTRPYLRGKGKEDWKLGNLVRELPDYLVYLASQPKPKPEKDAPPPSKEPLVLWTRASTPEDIERLEKFKHTRRGKVDEWEALRDSFYWEWMTEDEASKYGWEIGRGFTDRERRELLAAQERRRETVPV